MIFRRASRWAESHRTASWQIPVTLRLADEADTDAVSRVACRETRPLPPGPWLVAERRGRIEVALSLSSGELVADPFARTLELVELVRTFAADGRTGPKPAGAFARPAAPAIGSRLAGAGGCA